MKNVKKVYAVLSVLLTAIILTACIEESEYEKRRKAEDERINAYLNEHDITATKDPSGLYYQPLIENAQGESISTNDVISIYYDMQTLEGEQLEKTTDSLAPLRFKHDYQSIIPLGLDYGIQLMQKGEKYRFFIPSTLAYGNYGDADFFDAGSLFILEVEVVDIQTESEIYALEMDSIQSYITNNEIEDIQLFSSGLQYKVLEEGTGAIPSSKSKVTFHYERRYLDGTVLEKTSAGSPVVVQLGSGVVEGLEEGILKMKKGGKSLMILPSKIAFKGSIEVLPTDIRDQLIEDNVVITKVRPYSPVIYEVELVDIGN